MPLVPLKVPPGVYRNGTQYQVGGRWYDANLVRWNDGLMLPVGGWQRLNSAAPFTGVCRGLYAWRKNTVGRYLAIGTNSNLYAWDESGNLIDITPTSFPAGRVSAIYGLGYGISTYGTTAYGVARSGGGNVSEAATWSFDNWGDHLVACAPHEGHLLEWDLNAANKAAVITNAPASCRGVIVTPERYLVALGAGDNPRKVQWSNQEDNTVWTPSATNTAGDQELQTNGSIYTAKRVRGQTLILTSTDAHTMTYLGPPFVYGFERVGSFCGVAGPNAAAAVDSFCVWMSDSNFHIFDGALNILPCDVRDYVFGDFNRPQASKVYAGVNAQHKEIWWFYPSADSDECNRYVTWNYAEKHWSIGQLARTAWTSTGVFPYPMAAGTDGYVYEHEHGWTANGASLASSRYVESGAVEIGNGDNVSVVRQMLPDERSQGQTQVKFKTRFTPEGAQSTYGPYSLTNYTDLRFTGRQVALRVEGVADDAWRVGVPRLDIVAGGRR